MKKYDGYQADDGSLHSTEREALIADLAYIFKRNPIGHFDPITKRDFEITVAKAIADNVSPVLTILRQLSEPRNAPPKKPEPPVKLEDIGQTIADEGELEHDETFQMNIDPGDLRDGQIIRLSPEAKRLDPTVSDYVDEGEWRIIHVSDDNGVSLELTGHAMEAMINVDFTFIAAVLYQPEELMTLEEAKTLVDRLGDDGLRNLDDPMGRLNHRRLILARKRIHDLETADGEQ